jgi:hypothetical protein
MGSGLGERNFVQDIMYATYTAAIATGEAMQVGLLRDAVRLHLCRLASYCRVVALTPHRMPMSRSALLGRHKYLLAI